MYQPLSFNVSFAIIFILNSFSFKLVFFSTELFAYYHYLLFINKSSLKAFLMSSERSLLTKKWKYLLKHKIINIFHMPFISTFNHYLNYTKPLNCFVLENTVIFYLTILIPLDISNLEFLYCPSKCHCLFACSLYWQFVLYQSINQDYLTNKNNKRSCWRAKFSRYKKE